jgi:tetratricopeptide (TPR) repeat protein
MATDPLGNPVTDGPPDALAGVNQFVEGFLAYETRAAEVLAAADRAPGHALMNAYAAVLWLLLEAPEAVERASPFLARAEAAAPGANARERALIQAVRAWSDGDVPRTLEVLDGITDAHPRDLLALKLQHYHQFNLGRFADMLRAADKVAAANADTPWMHGMLAFAYEQCHLLREAEACARRALEMQRKEPWAQHALAHVMLTQGRIDEGAAFLEDIRDTWTGLNSFMVTHLWWHLALFHQSQGRDREVLDAYDLNVWAVSKDYSQDQVNAVSLLARIELAGVDVGERWTDIGAHLAPRATDTEQPFLTVQYLYGLARAGRPEAQALMAAIRSRSETAPAFVRETWADVALPLAEGLLAHARGEWDQAVRRLDQALPRLIEIGGSHAQRDLFEQVLLDAVIRSGRLDRAQQALELRRKTDADGVPVNTALADVYAKLGLAALSRAAAERGARTVARFAPESTLTRAAAE